MKNFLVALILLLGSAAAANAQFGCPQPGPPCVVVQPFTGIAGGYTPISATTTSGSTAVQLAGLPSSTTGLNVGIINTGTDAVFIKLGGSSVTVSTSTGTPVYPGQPATLPLGSATYIAALANSGTQAIVVMVGTGVLAKNGGGSSPAPPVQTITVATPSTQTSGVGFQISGTYTGTAPTGIDYQIDGGSYSALSSPTIGGGTWSSAAGAVTISSTGLHTVGVREQPHTYVVATSGQFSVISGGGGCSNSLDFSASCNSQYIPVM